MPHPQHPNCPDCKKALFKSPVAKKVRPTDPYAYCRNKGCSQYTFRMLGPGFDPKKSAVKADVTRALKVGATGPLKRHHGQDEKANAIREKHASAQPKPAPETTEKAPPPDTKPTSKRNRKRAAVPLSEAPKPPSEPEPIAKARKRLKELLAQVIPGGTSNSSAGLVLAILSQETGNHKAAEALIDEYQLDEKFGLKKFSQISTG